MKNPSVLLAAALAVAAPAYGGPWDLFGASPLGTAAGGAMAAAAFDPSLAYYNPAGLVGATRAAVRFGFGWDDPLLYVNRQSTSSSVATVMPVDFSDARFSFLQPVGGGFGNRVALGVALSMPTLNIVRVQALDAGRPQFFLFQSDPDRFTLFTGMGIALTPQIHVGLGTQVLAQLNGPVDVSLELFDKRFKSRNLTVDLGSIFAPDAGIWVQPIPALQLGLTWRSGIDISYRLPMNIGLGSALGGLFLSASGITHWWPPEAVFGARWNQSPRLWIEGDVGYAFWSQAPVQSVRVEAHVFGPVADKLGISPLLQLDSSQQDAPMGLSDVVEPRLGVGWQYNSWLQLLAGYFFRPSPVPDQTEQSNYLDASAHGLSAGAAASFADPFGVLKNPLTAELGSSASVLVPRSVVKHNDSDPPVGNYDFGGAVLEVQAALTYVF